MAFIPFILQDHLHLNLTAPTKPYQTIPNQAILAMTTSGAAMGRCEGFYLLPIHQASCRPPFLFLFFFFFFFLFRFHFTGFESNCCLNGPGGEREPALAGQRGNASVVADHCMYVRVTVREELLFLNSPSRLLRIVSLD